MTLRVGADHCTTVSSKGLLRSSLSAKNGLRVLLSTLVSTSLRIAHTRKRREKIALLATLLRSLEHAEIALGVAFLAGELPQRRIGIGPAALGEISVAPARVPSLTLCEVNQTFARIKKVSGTGAANERNRLLLTLMARAAEDEQSFLSRLILGELRQGASEGIMVEAIALAANAAADDVRRAVMFVGETPVVAQATLIEGDAGLRRFTVRLMTPVKPMLAQTSDGVDDALYQLGTAGLEYKLDGVRVQLHKVGASVRVFTRRLYDVSDSVPELLELGQRLSAERVILDGEALAIRTNGRPYPFQTTMRRFGRKLDVGRLRVSLPLSMLFFDCLYLDGESLIDLGGQRRFAALRAAVPSQLVIPRLETPLPEDAEAFLRQALQLGHEGIMAKSLDAPYQAGQRGRAWLKLKPAHLLDMVVLAAEWGHGRRRGWLSNLHLGALDPTTGNYVMLGKTFKGLTDEMLSWQTRNLLEREIARDADTVYVRPQLVVEVAFNEVQASPQYPAGLALRFARVKGFRPDKAAQDADTIVTVQRIWEKQRAPGPH